jgi:hypothetical protein
MTELTLRRRPPSARIFRLVLLAAFVPFLETDLSFSRFQLSADFKNLQAGAEEGFVQQKCTFCPLVQRQDS